MKNKNMRRMVLILCLVVLTGASGLAQAGYGRGRLSGSVRDEAGNPIAGALVALEFEQSGRRAETAANAKGEWAFIGVGTGRAKLTITASGLQSVIIHVQVSQLQRNSPVPVVLKPGGTKAVEAEPVLAPGTDKGDGEELVTRTYELNYVTPKFVRDSLGIYLRRHSYSEGSKLISVMLPKKDVAAFEKQLRELDVERRMITLRIFTVIASREGKGEAVENRDLKKVLAEVSNLLNFRSYVLDGVSTISAKDGADFGRVALSSSSALSGGMQFDFRRLSLATGSGGKKAVKFGFALIQLNTRQELLNSETEIAEDGYLVAGVSRLGDEGKSLVLVINAEIK